VVGGTRGVRGQSRLQGVSSEQRQQQHQDETMTQKDTGGDAGGSTFNPENNRNSFRPDDEVVEEEDEDPHDMLDQELLMLRQADPAGANRKILGETQEQVRQEIREEHRSNYHDFGWNNDESNGAHENNNSEVKKGQSADEQRAAEESSADEDYKQVHIIQRRKGEAPVQVSTDEGDSSNNADDEKKTKDEAAPKAQAETDNHKKRASPIEIDADRIAAQE